MAVVVFVFRGYRDAQYSAAQAEDVIGCFGSLERFADYFSGYAAYRDWMSGQRFLGVWGARNCARFRRLLGEWGGGVDVAHCNPPGSPHSNQTRSGRASAPRRQQIEATVKLNWERTS
ncbi:MAG: hypothetical protein J0I48_20510 [Devosia sp.]|uniref:hypothetical protein n=1 Tax=Devosia sp. 66-22 TaxID=1895753 RepID=UPI00092A8234|nr:hypothetical protein [Devosia sp. 66-22]MBN9348552.1 hypothetical protein [Devosia sp.]OJX55038.1 MAG: hypothetical protein BGO81_00900 [Devosia sp. 66-22]